MIENAGLWFTQCFDDFDNTVVVRIQLFEIFDRSEKLAPRDSAVAIAIHAL